MPRADLIALPSPEYRGHMAVIGGYATSQGRFDR
jgi:hypothetical protein